jgi:hypothetical protein
VRIVRPGNPAYNESRAISNARFDYFPWAIYYCESAEDVRTVIRNPRVRLRTVRIRSGGHQHEGMCSASHVGVIDLTGIHSIRVDERGKCVWIGAGASLKDVYYYLWERRYLFAGGGCGDVHVGGLTQGGGWGPVSRKFGLTCDSLIAVEMVTANGQILEIPRAGHEEDRALLQALRGGGGGNFGVITRFCFRLHPWKQGYTDVTLKWSDENLPKASLDRFVLNWIRSFPRDSDNNLTTFLRISVVDDPGGDRVVIGGRYLGTETRARATIDRLLAGQPPPREAKYAPSLVRFAPVTKGGRRIDPRRRELLRRSLGTLPEYQPGPARIGATAPDSGVAPDLSDTCAGVPIRHKVSSGFARTLRFDLKSVQAMTRVIRNSTRLDGARRYVSLHCLGGAIANDGDGSSYAFRDRNVLLQYQAWWLPDAANLDEPCIAWVDSFRKTMTPHTDGAFINFVDRNIALAEYYKDKLPRLIEAKRRWDPDNFFRFEMSIPVK